MSRGLPDYGLPSFPVALPDTSNDSVLTALFGFAPMDTRGRIVIMETFKDGYYTWGTRATGGGIAPRMVLEQQHSFASPIGIKLEPGIAAALSILEKGVMLIEPGKIGMEGAFWGGATSSSMELFVQANISGVGLVSAGVKYRPDTGLFYVYTGLGWFSIGTVTGVSLSANSGWVPMKVVFDSANASYTRFVFGHKDYDISSLSPDVDPILDVHKCLFAARSEAVAGFGSAVYLGYYIVTRDEP